MSFIAQSEEDATVKPLGAFFVGASHSSKRKVIFKTLLALRTRSHLLRLVMVLKNWEAKYKVWMDGKGMIQYYLVLCVCIRYTYIYTSYMIYGMITSQSTYYLLHIGYIQTTNDTVLVTSEFFFFRSRSHGRSLKPKQQTALPYQQRLATSSNHTLTPPENRPYQHLPTSNHPFFDSKLCC